MSVLLGVGAGLTVAVVLVRVLENRFVFFPPRYPEGFVSPEHYGLRVEDVWFTAADGVKLNAWFLPNGKKTFLWFHGNAENIGQGVSNLKFYARLGASVLALDYRGFGRSEGSPDERGVYRDADAAYDYLVKGRRIRPEDIIVFGHSLGGAVAIDLASRRGCGGLIVESSFTSAREMARRMFRVPLFEYVPKSRFDSIRKIAQVRAPVLVIHGTRDPVVPFAMGQRLFEAARGEKYFFPLKGAGHDDLVESGGGRYLERLKSFVESVAPPTSAGADGSQNAIR